MDPATIFRVYFLTKLYTKVAKLFVITVGPNGLMVDDRRSIVFTIVLYPNFQRPFLMPGEAKEASPMLYIFFKLSVLWNHMSSFFILFFQIQPCSMASSSYLTMTPPTRRMKSINGGYLSTRALALRARLIGVPGTSTTSGFVVTLLLRTRKRMMVMTTTRRRPKPWLTLEPGD